MIRGWDGYPLVAYREALERGEEESHDYQPWTDYKSSLFSSYSNVSWTKQREFVIYFNDVISVLVLACDGKYEVQPVIMHS